MKPRLNNNGVITEFDTEQELADYIAANHPGDAAAIQNSQFIINQAKREKVGRDIVNDLFQKLEQQALSQGDEAQIVNKISTCMVTLLSGSIKGARVICNALTTDTVFTAQRKTYLLNQIDNAIANL